VNSSTAAGGGQLRIRRAMTMYWEWAAKQICKLRTNCRCMPSRGPQLLLFVPRAMFWDCRRGRERN
jgi:hypothetical protein